MSRAELAVPVDINAPAATVWDVVTDWAAQGEWMLGTRVTVARARRRPPARRAGCAAFTGVGPLGFTDTMEIVEWEPPRRCVVAPHRQVVRGDGVFEVVPSSVRTGPGSSGPSGWTCRSGAVGALGWPLVRPAFRLGVEQSLRRLGRICEARHRAG